MKFFHCPYCVLSLLRVFGNCFFLKNMVYIIRVNSDNQRTERNEYGKLQEKQQQQL